MRKKDEEEEENGIFFLTQKFNLKNLPTLSILTNNAEEEEMYWLTTEIQTKKKPNSI